MSENEEILLLTYVAHIQSLMAKHGSMTANERMHNWRGE
jgi:hypothetical protein